MAPWAVASDAPRMAFAPSRVLCSAAGAEFHLAPGEKRYLVGFRMRPQRESTPPGPLLGPEEISLHHIQVHHASGCERIEVPSRVPEHLPTSIGSVTAREFKVPLPHVQPSPLGPWTFQ